MLNNSFKGTQFTTLIVFFICYLESFLFHPKMHIAAWAEDQVQWFSMQTSVNTRAEKPRKDYNPQMGLHQPELHLLWYSHSDKISNLERQQVTNSPTHCESLGLFCKPWVLCNRAAFVVKQMFLQQFGAKKQPEGVNTQSGKWNQMTHWKYFRTFNSRFHCRCYVLFLSFLWCFCLPPSLQDQTVFGLSNYGTVLLCFDGFYICCNFAKSISNEPADRLTGDKTSRIFWQDKKIIR